MLSINVFPKKSIENLQHIERNRNQEKKSPLKIQEAILYRCYFLIVNVDVHEVHARGHEKSHLQWPHAILRSLH